MDKKSEKHQIAISENIWQKIKDFCTLNNLKANEYVEKALSDAIITDMYGFGPFITQKPSDVKKTAIEEKTEDIEPSVITDEKCTIEKTEEKSEEIKTNFKENNNFEQYTKRRRLN